MAIISNCGTSTVDTDMESDLHLFKFFLFLSKFNGFVRCCSSGQFVSLFTFTLLSLTTFTPFSILTLICIFCEHAHIQIYTLQSPSSNQLVETVAHNYTNPSLYFCVKNPMTKHEIMLYISLYLPALLYCLMSILLFMTFHDLLQRIFHNLPRLCTFKC